MRERLIHTSTLSVSLSGEVLLLGPIHHVSACFRVQRALTPLNWLTGTMTKSILLDECCWKRQKYEVKVIKETLVFLVFSLLLPPNWKLALIAG